MKVKFLTLKRLLDSNVYIGHSYKNVVPMTLGFLAGIRNKMFIINLEYTLLYFRLALFFLNAMPLHKRNIFCIVGINPIYSQLIKFTALRISQFFFVQKWINGYFSNFKEISTNTTLASKYTNLTRLPAITFCVNVDKKKFFVNECWRARIALIGFVDSNIDSTALLFPIPGNDDSLVSISLYMEVISKLVLRSISKECRNIKLNCKILDYEFKRNYLYNLVYLLKILYFFLKTNFIMEKEISFYIFKKSRVLLNNFFFKSYNYAFDYKEILTLKIFYTTINSMLIKKMGVHIVE